MVCQLEARRPSHENCRKGAQGVTHFITPVGDARQNFFAADKREEARICDGKNKRLAISY
jgi:hypothetical protein